MTMDASGFTKKLVGIVSIGLLCAPPARAQRTAVEAEHGMVVSVYDVASQVGADVLKKGGNAVDAAVATGLALAVVYPYAGNIGGGGFMMIHLADGRDVAIDYRETAPAAASHDMYLGKNGKPLPRGPGSSTQGWSASGVPGSVAGFALALEKYGSHKFAWAELVEPARRLAADGHVVTAFNASRLLVRNETLAPYADSKRIFLKDGALRKAGEIFSQPELAATLARLQKDGPREFYEGETARLIADGMAKNGGTITLADLKNYRAVERTPLHGTYRGYDVVTMPPPSSGGVLVLEMLAMLEPFDLAKLGPNSSAKYHLLAEVMRRAFRGRAIYFGDPDFVKVPVAGLLDRGYLATLMKNFDPAKATPSTALPDLAPAGWDAAAPKAAAAQSQDTTHFSIVDAAGNAVANTYTLNGGFGSGVTIPGTGILMNNEMDDFTAKPGSPNFFGLVQGEANAVAPGRRPLSSMTPTFVFKDRRLFLVTGAPGGGSIPNGVLQVIVNVIDHDMPVGFAVEAPRIHHQWLPDGIGYEPYGLSVDVVEALRGRGHILEMRNTYGPEKKVPLSEYYPNDTMTIMIDPKTNLRLGAADPRKPDAKAVGY